MKTPDETGTGPERIPVAQREPGAQGKAPDRTQEKGQREAGEGMEQLRVSLWLGKKDGKKSYPLVSLSR